MKYTSKEYEEFIDDLKIDQDRLDEVTIEQPNLFFHASEAHKLAMAVRDKAENDLHLIYANLDKEIRETLTANEEKFTEPSIKQEILRDQSYQRSYSDYLRAKLTSDKWEALQAAYKQRIDALKILQNLYSSGYFGEVTGSVERRDARFRFDNNRRRE